MLIEVKALNKTYQTGQVTTKALDDVTMSVKKGDRCVILGPSGSGKSTLLNLIGGIDRPSGGQIFIDGEEISQYSDASLTEYRRMSVGFVFQFYNLVHNLTVYENVELAAHISNHPLRIKPLLEAVGLEELEHRFPGELSGGQQQRVSIARALVKKPKILFCDEPTGALDYQASKEILMLLEEVNRHFGTTILLITHNSAISGMANHVLRMRSGRISEEQFIETPVPAERISW